MGDLRVLDCTLRDGGYCNQWKFGKNSIQKIITGLMEADIDIIECGFLTNRVVYNEDVAKYTTLDKAGEMIPKERGNKLFVCMVNYGEYNLEDIPEQTSSSVDGLRVAFHKRDMNPALDFCRALQEKGYKVFIQAMVSLNYSDNEFLDLIYKVNEFVPYSFYIVDSFGVMKRKDLIRLFYMVEHNLKDGIAIGYHSHNNMQLAYSNAQALVDIRTNRDMIIDASIFGMGRGAGNLNTELFVEYLNDKIGRRYVLKPLLSIIDEILNSFYQQNYWGYSLPNYLSAKHNSHPDYAGYLDAKKTLTVENMDEIFSMMEETKRSSYDKEYIEQLYMKYMERGYVQENRLTDFKDKITGKSVLVIAPGCSSIEEKDRIIACAQKEDVVTIGINFDYSQYETDFIFLSNLRRFRELDVSKYSKCIVTSNIPSVDIYLQTKYQDLLNDIEAVRDNAGMMLIKYLIQLGVKKVFIAGLDGYSADPTQNFADEKMNFFTKKVAFEAMNSGMTKVLQNYSKCISIEFITTPRHVVIKD